ncbi:hypothetical protein LP419_08500 [Massilia sp. H-1]|nr:hypothetical protein LP419_08500 [Massilia sp. H-1]
MDEAQALITAAEAVPNRTPFENYFINSIKIPLGYASNNDKMRNDAMEYAIASGFLEKKDIEDFLMKIANGYYNAKDYPKAVEAFKRYQKESSTPEKANQGLIRSYYFSNDMANTQAELEKNIAAAEAAGKTPGDEELRMLANVFERSKDKVAYGKVIDKLLVYYPTPDFWAYSLQVLNNRKGFDDRLLRLDYYRLLTVTSKGLNAEQIGEYVEQALQSASFAEAKKVMDKGYESGVMGQGADASKHKQLRDKVNKAAAEDAATIGNGEACASKAKTGQPLVNLGFTYVTMDQFDKGIDLMHKGIAKGGLKAAKEVELRLGIAYAMAGNKAEAVKIFDGLKGTPDIVGDLARYWIIYVNGPKGAPVAKA